MPAARPEPEIDDRRCRLLVELAATVSPELADRLAALAAVDRLAAVVVDPDAPAPTVALATARLLAGAFEPLPMAHGVVVEVGDDAEMEVTALRRAWGVDGIVVAEVGTSQHRAMEAGEFGADAILFDGPLDAVVDCLTWWQALFVLPVAARATAATLETLVQAGADFLLVDAATVTADVDARIAAAEASAASANREQ